MAVDGNENKAEEQQQQQEQDPANRKRRKRRWGEAAPAAAPQTVPAVDGRAKVLALQESVKARLAAAKAAQQQKTQTDTVAAPTDDARAKVLALQESVKARLAAAKAAQSVPPTAAAAGVNVSRPAKKAKHYELDLTVTAPTYKQSSSGETELPPIIKTETKPVKPKPQKPSNPYLAHQVKEEDNDENSENNDETNNNDPSLLRVVKPRQRNKSFKFLEPGTWQERADKLREKEVKIAASGFTSGRKKGHSIISASLGTADIYGGGGGGGGGVDIGEDDSDLVLPPRADAHPDNVHVMPSITEWWDVELLPSKLRKRVATIEQEKDAKTLIPETQKTTTKIKLEDMDDENNQNKETKTNNNDDVVQELRQRCYEQASLSYSKTAELVQHIVPIKPKIVATPGTASVAPKKQDSVVLHLTKKERKRQRKLRRQEKQQELQDLQAAGLIPAPEPRLTLQNFFQVLGDNAVTDPSQIEKTVQEQMQARLQSHLERNAQNKLTKEQRAAKKASKLAVQDATAQVSQQITVALFYVKDMSHPYHRTKLDLNAQQLSITGGVLECTPPSVSQNDDSSLACVIAEGNPKSIKLFTRLMTVRMKWTGPDDDEDDNEGEEEGEYGLDENSTVPKKQKFNPANKCEFVWQGLSVKRNFQGFIFQACEHPNQARKILKARGVEHYWDQVTQLAKGKSSGNFQLKLYTNEEDNGHPFGGNHEDDVIMKDETE